MSYIPLYIREVYRFFEPFLIDTNISKMENAWLEFESVPLKWLWSCYFDHSVQPQLTCPATGTGLLVFFMTYLPVAIPPPTWEMPKTKNTTCHGIWPYTFRISQANTWCAWIHLHHFRMPGSTASKKYAPKKLLSWVYLISQRQRSRDMGMRKRWWACPKQNRQSFGKDFCPVRSPAHCVCTWTGWRISKTTLSGFGTSTTSF